jgi:hypothetical protein
MIEAFEGGRIDATDFHHAQHVELAWRYLELLAPDEALARFRTALQRFAARIGKARLYDEAVTAGWMGRIAARRNGEASWDEFAKKNEDLLDKRTLHASRT